MRHEQAVHWLIIQDIRFLTRSLPFLFSPYCAFGLTYWRDNLSSRLIVVRGGPSAKCTVSRVLVVCHHLRFGAETERRQINVWQLCINNHFSLYLSSLTHLFSPCMGDKHLSYCHLEQFFPPKNVIISAINIFHCGERATQESCCVGGILDV